MKLVRNLLMVGLLLASAWQVWADGSFSGQAYLPAEDSAASVQKTVSEFVKSGWDKEKLAAMTAHPMAFYASSFCLPMCDMSYLRMAMRISNPTKSIVVHYTGNVSAPETGWYRFVGAGDDMLLVRLQETDVLAVGKGWEKIKDSAPAQKVKGNRKQKQDDNATVVYQFPKIQTWNTRLGGFTGGRIFKVEKGRIYKMQVLFADAGDASAFCLYIEKLAAPEKAPHGKVASSEAPLLPLFSTTTILPAVENMANAIAKVTRNKIVEIPPFSRKPQPWAVSQEEPVDDALELYQSGPKQKKTRKKKKKKSKSI
jgi:hypothetical protein